jgi:hypothetical protein
MPKKKYDPAAELQGGAPVEEVKHPPLCNHINRQHSNIAGELEALACTLEPGHAGDHSAKVQALRKNPYPVKNPKAEYLWREGAEYEVVTVPTFWSDSAGTPADKIAPDYGGKTREEWVNERRAKALEGKA